MCMCLGAPEECEPGNDTQHYSSYRSVLKDLRLYMHFHMEKDGANITLFMWITSVNVLSQPDGEAVRSKPFRPNKHRWC